MLYVLHFKISILHYNFASLGSLSSLFLYIALILLVIHGFLKSKKLCQYLEYGAVILLTISIILGAFYELYMLNDVGYTFIPPSFIIESCTRGLCKNFVILAFSVPLAINTALFVYSAIKLVKAITTRFSKDFRKAK